MRKEKGRENNKKGKGMEGIGEKEREKNWSMKCAHSKVQQKVYARGTPLLANPCNAAKPPPHFFFFNGKLFQT